MQGFGWDENAIETARSLYGQPVDLSFDPTSLKVLPQEQTSSIVGGREKTLSVTTKPNSRTSKYSRRPMPITLTEREKVMLAADGLEAAMNKMNAGASRQSVERQLKKAGGRDTWRSGETSKPQEQQGKKRTRDEFVNSNDYGDMNERQRPKRTASNVWEERRIVNFVQNKDAELDDAEDEVDLPRFEEINPPEENNVLAIREEDNILALREEKEVNDVLSQFPYPDMGAFFDKYIASISLIKSNVFETVRVAQNSNIINDKMKQVIVENTQKSLALLNEIGDTPNTILNMEQIMNMMEQLVYAMNVQNEVVVFYSNLNEELKSHQETTLQIQNESQALIVAASETKLRSAYSRSSEFERKADSLQLLLDNSNLQIATIQQTLKEKALENDSTAEETALTLTNQQTYLNQMSTAIALLKTENATKDISISERQRTIHERDLQVKQIQKRISEQELTLQQYMSDKNATTQNLARMIAEIANANKWAQDTTVEIASLEERNLNDRREYDSAIALLRTGYQEIESSKNNLNAQVVLLQRQLSSQETALIASRTRFEHLERTAAETERNLRSKLASEEKKVRDLQEVIELSKTTNSTSAQQDIDRFTTAKRKLDEREQTLINDKKLLESDFNMKAGKWSIEKARLEQQIREDEEEFTRIKANRDAFQKQFDESTANASAMTQDLLIARKDAQENERRAKSLEGGYDDYRKEAADKYRSLEKRWRDAEQKLIDERLEFDKRIDAIDIRLTQVLTENKRLKDMKEIAMIQHASAEELLMELEANLDGFFNDSIQYRVHGTLLSSLIAMMKDKDAKLEANELLLNRGFQSMEDLQALSTASLQARDDNHAEAMRIAKEKWEHLKEAIEIRLREYETLGTVVELKELREREIALTAELQETKRLLTECQSKGMSSLANTPSKSSVEKLQNEIDSLKQQLSECRAMKIIPVDTEMQDVVRVEPSNKKEVVVIEPSPKAKIVVVEPVKSILRTQTLPRVVISEPVKSTTRTQQKPVPCVESQGPLLRSKCTTSSGKKGVIANTGRCMAISSLMNLFKHRNPNIA